MNKNPAKDPKALDHAVKVSRDHYKDAALAKSLRGGVARGDPRRVAALFGKFDWDPSFDYKAERSRPR